MCEVRLRVAIQEYENGRNGRNPIAQDMPVSTVFRYTGLHSLMVYTYFMSFSGVVTSGPLLNTIRSGVDTTNSDRLFQRLMHRLEKERLRISVFVYCR